MIRELIKILELSVTKNGPDKPVTLGHLLNIVKLAAKEKSRNIEAEERRLDGLYNLMEDDRNG